MARSTDPDLARRRPPTRRYRRAAALLAARRVSRLAPDELAEILARYATFRAANPRAPVSLLEFALRDEDARPKEGASG